VIAVDTSAIMAVVLDEPLADLCIAALAADPDILISAGTLAEALIVAGCRNVSQEVTRLIDGLGLQIVAVTPATSRRIAAAYAKWGRGMHPAGLNFGDCFAYDLARDNGCRLLYVGHDFARTDIPSVL